MSQSAMNWQVAEQRHEELRRTFNDGQIEILQRQTDLETRIGGRLNSVYNLLVGYERQQRERVAALQKRNDELERGCSDLKHRNYQLQMSLTPNVPSGPNTEWHKKQEDLWTALGGFSFEEQDMKYTIEKQERLPSHERAMTEQLVNTPRFREWMVSPMSRQLLIQGNLTGDRQISTLSVFCSTFTSTIRQGLKYITLVHICGLHTDLNRDVDAGPRGMIMSFIAQLLWQWDFDTTFLFENVDLSWFEYGWDPSTKNLCDLLIWMIRQLPSSQTAFFVVDGIHHYEKDVYVIALMESIASILETTLDERVNATVKVLVTSPCRVVETREGFPDDAILLLIESPGTSLDIISSRRLEHQIARTLETS